MKYIIEYNYEESGDPIMRIRPDKAHDTSCVPFAVHLRDAWMYTEDHNPNFVNHMKYVCRWLFESWQIGLLTSRGLAEIATAIEDGIEGLLATPPQPDEHYYGKTVGEGVLIVNNDQKYEFEVKENGLG